MSAVKLTKRDDVWVPTKCPHCNFGRVPAGVFGPVVCKHCDGTGQLVTYGRTALAQGQDNG